MIILEKIPVLILMLVSLFGFLSGETIKCKFSRNMTDNSTGIYQYTASVSMICCLFLWILSGFNVKVSLYTVIMAILFGTLIMGQIMSSALAMKIGPWAYTAVMMSLSTVIPALSGVLFWNEKLGVNKILGIILMIICFVLSVKNNEEDINKKKSNVKWFLLSLIASLCTGGFGILQKMHQSSVYKNELSMFLVISFAFSGLISYIIMNIKGIKNKTNKNHFNKKIILFFALAGIGTAFNHSINLYLSGAMESAVFFPVMSGGELVFVTLTSVLIFKEKLSKKQWIGLMCGILATIILCI